MNRSFLDSPPEISLLILNLSLKKKKTERDKRRKKGQQVTDRGKSEGKEGKKNSPAILVPLYQRLRPLINKQIQNQRRERTALARLLKHRVRVFGRGHRVCLVGYACQLVHGRVLRPFDPQLVRQDPEPDESEERGAALERRELLVCQCLGVHPLDQVLEVAGTGGGEGERGGAVLAEVVCGGEGGGEEGRDGAEELKVAGEGLLLASDGDGDDGAEEGADGGRVAFVIIAVRRGGKRECILLGDGGWGRKLLLLVQGGFVVVSVARNAWHLKGLRREMLLVHRFRFDNGGHGLFLAEGATRRTMMGDL